jgi:protocatechuate 3,4-dioxygenase beta subunit
MNAFILVFNHRFFSVTDADGRYRIDNVPPGTYNVIAWNEGLASEPRAATVPDGGTAELDFQLR